MRGGVFVCHASQDAGVAQRIVAALEAGGVSCWIAPRDIDAGQNYAMAILEGLDAAPAVVLIFSAATNQSPHVIRELETAASAGTPIVPVRLADVDPSAALRYFIGAAHWLDTVGTAEEMWEPPLVRAVRRTVEESSQAGASWTPSGDGYPNVPGSPEHLTPTPVAISPEPEPEPKRRRRRAALVVVGALILVLGLVGFFALTGNEDDSASDRDGTQSEVTVLPPGTMVWTDESDGWRLRGALPGDDAITILDDDTDHETWPQVLPGGARVLYLSDSNGEPSDGLGLSLRVANVDGSEDTAFLDGEPFCPNPARAAVNTDGGVAVTCFDDVGERMSGIVLLSPAGELLRVLETDAAAGGVAWMPDGKSLVYWMETSDVIKGEPGQNLYLIDPDSLVTTRLTEASSRDVVPAVSPDGDTIVFGRVLEDQRGADLYLMSLEYDGGGYQAGEAVLLGASSPTVPDTDPAWVTNETLVFCQDGDMLSVDADPEATATPALDGLDVGEARHVTVVR